jgi:queuosine precursor transporter
MKDLFKSKSTNLFLVLAGFFFTNALVAEFIGVKIFSLEATFGFKPLNLSVFGVDGLGFNLSAGVLMWPVVFVITDILNEYFGKKVIQILSYVTVGLILYAFFMVYLAIGASPNDWWQNLSGTMDADPSNHLPNMDLAFSKIMGQGLWIIVGSLVAFLVGQLVDVLVFHKIKKWTGEKNIWMRATGSTLISQFIDSYVVLFIAFYIGADWDPVRVIAIGTVNYMYKFTMALLLTPVIYIVHNRIDAYLGKEESEKLRNEAMMK